MKRIMVILLAAVMAALCAGCSSDSTSVEKTEPVSEAVTQEPTAPPATEHPDEVYTNEACGWRVTIPGEWFTYGDYNEIGNYPNAQQYGLVTFFHRELFFGVDRGRIFSIMATPLDSYRNDGVDANTGHGGYLGANDEYAFYWFYGVISPDDPNYAVIQQYEQELEELESMRDAILASFTIL